MNVLLRKRTPNKSGRITLQLEIYMGYTKTPDGKIRNKKEYEKLDYFLYANPKSPQEKAHNKEHLRKAEALKGERLKELINGKNGFKDSVVGRVNLLEYFRKLTNERLQSKGNYDNWDSTLKHLTKYCSATITVGDVTADFAEGFKNYLLKEAKKPSGKTLATNSALSYFNKFRAAINQAYDDGLLADNPLKKVKGIKQEETMREYLTLDELKMLAKTECRYDVLKRAFLFSCLTGLRWSDIHKMTWSEVEPFDERWRVRFTQQKTKSIEYLDISNQARGYLGEKGALNERVFVGLKYSAYVNVALTQWMLRAGITKPITFHSGRHTFATIQLTLGTELYTVSKLLGHRELKTTQIYAKIIDQKKIDAVNKIPDLI